MRRSFLLIAKAFTILLYGRCGLKRDVSGAEEFLNKAKFDEGAVNANLEKFAKTLREAIEQSKQQSA